MLRGYEHKKHSKRLLHGKVENRATEPPYPCQADLHHGFLKTQLKARNQWWWNRKMFVAVTNGEGWRILLWERAILTWVAEWVCVTGLRRVQWDRIGWWDATGINVGIQKNNKVNHTYSAATRMGSIGRCSTVQPAGSVWGVKGNCNLLYCKLGMRCTEGVCTQGVHCVW